MAEAFGIVSGTVSLASLFTSSIECFKYIQLGRQFERDYTQSLVTLKLLETRLSRWGTAVGVYDDYTPLGSPKATPLDLQPAADAIYQILQLFSESRRRSERFSPATTAYSTVDIHDPNYSALIRTTNLINSKRKRGPGILKLVSWIIYERESLRELLDGISNLMDQLEVLFPAMEMRQRLADDEISELCRVVQLEVLQKMTLGVDELLQSRARDTTTQRTGHYFGIISVDAHGQVSNGNIFTASHTTSGYVSPTGGHVYNEVKVSGNSKVHNGDWFGTSPFGGPA